MSERVTVDITIERPELDELLAAARARGPLTPDEIEAQRQSWARSCAPELRGDREARPVYDLEAIASEVVKNKSRWVRMIRWVIRFLIKRYGV